MSKQVVKVSKELDIQYIKNNIQLLIKLSNNRYKYSKVEYDLELNSNKQELIFNTKTVNETIIEILKELEDYLDI